MDTRPQDEALGWLARCDHSVIRPGLERISRLLDAWGRPHARLTAIHLAGTNGKGSTAAMIAAMLQAAGYRTGLYTSPHLHTLNERIRINGQPIPTGQLAGLAGELRALLEQSGHGGSGDDLPTYFECTTAIALTWLAREGVDWAIIETGLGGRFDATNLVTPRVSVLTPIDYDHMDYLGNSLASIAWEKAGILKPGVPAVIAPQQPEALSVIEREARALGAPLIRCGREFSYEEEAAQQLAYRDARRELAQLRIPLPGRHQLMNAAVATAAALSAVGGLRDGGVPLPDEAIRTGLASVRWEGRLELLQERPRLLLDGAHNPAAARALAAYLAEEKQRAGGKITVVFGVMRDKSAAGVVAALHPIVDRWIATAPATPRALPADQAAAVISAAGGAVTMLADPAEAAAEALRASAPEDLCCVTGSFYTVAAVREWFQSTAPRRRGERIALVPH